MIHECEPEYVFPHPTSFSEGVLPAMNRIVTDRVQDELMGAAFVAWTTDIWTSATSRSYITIRAHFIDDRYQLCSKVVVTRALSSSYTGEEVAEVLHKAITDSHCRSSAITTDKSVEMKAAAVAWNTPIFIHCFAETLEEAFSKAFEVPEVQALLERVRSIVHFLLENANASSVFAEKQTKVGSPSSKLILDDRTHQISSFLMVERIKEQQMVVRVTICDDAVYKDMYDSGITSPLLRDEEEKLCESVLAVLRPLHHAALAMSPEQKPTVGVVLPLLKKLKEFFEPKDTDSDVEKRMREAVLELFNSSYTENRVVGFLEEATALDGRFKHNLSEGVWARLANVFAKNEQENPGLWDMLVGRRHGDELVAVKSEDVKPEVKDEPREFSLPESLNLPGTSTACKVERSDSPPPKKLALSFLFDDVKDISNHAPTDSLKDRVAKEIALFKKEPRLPLHDDPLVFWKHNRAKYPYLATLAKLHLCAQPTSVTSERVFSMAGDVTIAARSCIDHGLVDKMIYLRENYDDDKDKDDVLKACRAAKLLKF